MASRYLITSARLRLKVHEWWPWFSVLAICPLAVLTWALFFFGDRNHSSAAACSDRLRVNGFVGNPDLYGLGIRLGIYLQWITFLIAEAELPEETSEITGAYAAFSIALLVAMLILIFEKGCVFTTEICVLLTILFGGFWCVLARKKSPASESSPARAEVLGLDMVPFSICVLALVVGTWYWMRMAILGPVDFVPTPSGTSFFLFAHITKDNLRHGSAFMAFFCIWIASTPIFKALTRWSVQSHQHYLQPFVRVILLFDLARMSENMENICHAILPYFGMSEAAMKKLTKRILSMLYSCVSIWFILAIELALRWNKVEGVNEIKTTGQIIPFVIGILSMLQILSKLLIPAAKATSVITAE